MIKSYGSWFGLSKFAQTFADYQGFYKSSSIHPICINALGIASPLSNDMELDALKTRLNSMWYSGIWL